jgi:hypothetical protein
MAAGLARQCESRLIVLVSERAAGIEAMRIIEATIDGTASVAHVPVGYEHAWTTFATTTHPEAGVSTYPDLSTKRNLAVLLARLLGWSRVLLLDDDITSLDARRVRAACRVLGAPHRAVGFKVGDHPDNSVVCHGVRAAGYPQDTFVGGSALLIDTASVLPFFPATYNEDLCFLCPLLVGRRVAQGGYARQLPYDAFDAPGRAIGQEFGDLLAEGLLSLVHLGAWSSKADASFWNAQMRGRRALIRRVADTMAASASHGRAVTSALEGAASRLETISPSACTTFIEDWLADAANWEDRVKALPRVRSLQQGMRALGLELI